MNKKEKKSTAINSIGMFDLAKGILMLAIIIGHAVTDFFHYWEYSFRVNVGLAFLGSLISVLMYGLIPMFYMICGYGFRKTTMNQSIKNQFRYFWKPYVIVVIATTMIVIVKKLITAGDVLEGLQYQVLPYFFAFCPGGRELFGIYMDSIGPIWFFWVFVTAGILLNVVLQEKQLWVQCVLVSALGFVGVNMRDMILPLCIQQTMICCGYMFIGWVMKKQGFLDKRFPAYLMILLMIFCIAEMLLGGNIEISQNVYANGMSDLVMSYGMGILFFYVFSNFSNLSGVFSEKVRWIGRNTLYFCCVHTVAYTVIPWEKLATSLQDQRVWGIVLELILQLMIAVVGCVIILKIQEKVRRISNGQKRD